MVVNHLTTQKYQIGDISTLNRLTAQNELSEHLQLFLLICKVDELSPRTLCDYAYKAGAFIKFCSDIGVNTPDMVSVNHIRMFLLKLQEVNQSKSVNGYYKVINRFFNWMVEDGILSNSPMAKIHPPKVPEKVIKPFRTEHIEKLLLCCDVSTPFLSCRNRAIVLTFLDTGLRLSELANIQLTDIDIDRGLIKVMGKGAKERVVGIGKATLKALLRYVLVRKVSHPWLWVTEERKPLSAAGISEVMKALKRRANLDGVRCSAHTFRHTFATQALINGAGEFDVQSLLGHSTLTMTRKYAATLQSENAVIGHRRWSPVDKMVLK